MKLSDQIELLNRGYSDWNSWRIEHPNEVIDFSYFNLLANGISESIFTQNDYSFYNFSKVNLQSSILKGKDFNSTDFTEANLSNCDFTNTSMIDAVFINANLTKADLSYADLEDSDFSNARLIEAGLGDTILTNATLNNADFTHADLSDSDFRNSSILRACFHDSNLSNANFENSELMFSSFVNTKLTKAKLKNSRIYGISVWNVDLDQTSQNDLIISKFGEPLITVDNFEIAQFVYLLLNNEKIRGFINVFSNKAVLILGRFSSEKLKILNMLKDELRKKNYLPILFDFENSKNRDISETITTLALLSKFIIADLSSPKSIPQELTLIIPNFPSIPVVPIIDSGEREYSMFEHFTKYGNVLPIIDYKDQNDLINTKFNVIIDNAERKIKEIRT